MNNIYIRCLRLLDRFMLPIISEFPFFVLFLLSISIMPIRFIPSHLHAFYMERIYNFLVLDFPRAGVITYVFTLLVYFTHSKLIKIVSYALATLLFTTCIFLHLVFHKTLQPDIITLIAETNVNESSEFLSSFLFTKGGILTLFVVFFYISVIIFSERRKTFIMKKLHHFGHRVCWGFLTFCFVICGTFQLKFYEEITSVNTIDDLPVDYGCYDSVTSLFYSLYSIRLVNLEMKHAVGMTKSVRQNVQVSDKDTLNVVYVIGESYIRSHSQLYGYELPTTPFLSNERQNGNLFVFDNVVSPFNQTSLTMKNTFCCNSLRHHEKWSDYPYFPAIFKKAGYQVYFWDVQKDDSVQALFEFSLNSFVYNKELMKESYTQVSKHHFQYDDQAVLDFQREAKLSANCNLVIFHLMGQHMDPSKRYPHTSLFEHFTSHDIKLDRPYLTEAKKQFIAEYDNATRYNDYVLKHIIDLFRHKNTVLLYFADHGEEVYDYRDSYGRVDLDSKQIGEGVKCQYEIPFMIWCSNLFIRNNPQIITDIKAALHRPFKTDEICQVLFHLSHLKTDYYKENQDLLSPDCLPYERVLDNGVNYDRVRK